MINIKVGDRVILDPLVRTRSRGHKEGIFTEFDPRSLHGDDYNAWGWVTFPDGFKQDVYLRYLTKVRRNLNDMVTQ